MFASSSLLGLTLRYPFDWFAISSLGHSRIS